MEDKKGTEEKDKRLSEVKTSTEADATKALWAPQATGKVSSLNSLK